MKSEYHYQAVSFKLYKAYTALQQKEVTFMKFFFLAAFITVSVIHLYASLKCNEKLRARTKVFILLFLLGWYCFSAAKVSKIVVSAILFSWLGDMLLIPDGTAWFSAGGAAFGLSHIFFIIAYNINTNLSVVPLWVIIFAAAVYFTASVFVFKSLKPHLPNFLFCPMFIYLLVNGAMNCFALYQLISCPCAAAAITFIGATQFFISDSILFYVSFNKKAKLKTHFTVMLTYIIAEFLIVLGLKMFGM